MSFERTYNRNMSYLKKVNPILFKKIEKQNIDDLELVINEDGSYNARYEGNLIYPSIDTTIRKNEQVDYFLSNPGIFYHEPIKNSPSYVSKYTNKVVDDILEHSTLKYGQRLLYEKYKHPKKTIPFLILFGVGTGEYILRILKKKEVLNLIILDKDYKFFKLSMHLIDWTEILKKFIKRPDSFTTIVGDDSKKLAYECINNIFAYNGMYTFYTQYMKHLSSDFFKETEKVIAESMFHAQTGWGFFEDEKLSLQHTLTNLKHSTKVFSPLNNLSQKKVLVIGSGPSLDRDLENIKSIQDKVFIISCGTSIRTLSKNNIKPDIHIEIERNLVTYHDLSKVDRGFLKNTILVGLNVLHPKVKTLFKESFLISRDNDAGSSLLDKTVHLKHANPTVVNGGVNLACELNFKEIYLLGVDNGFKDPKKHHSKDTIHSDKESDVYKEEMNYVLKKIKGNFTKEVYSTTEFLWCKQRLENCFMEYKNRKKTPKVFNCSDGAFLLNTISKRFDVLEFIDDLNKDKSLLYKNFKDIDKVYSVKEIKKELDYHKNFYSELLNEFTDLIDNSNINEEDDFFIILDECYQLIKRKHRDSQIVYSFLSGSIKILSSFIYSHLLASKKSEKENLLFINNSLEQMKLYVTYSYNMYLRIVENETNFKLK